MSAPESQTSADQALSSLMGAVGGNPEAPRLASAPVAPPRDWQAVQAAIDDYLEGYELRLDEGCHTPTEFEKFLLVDAVAGLMHDDEFIDALYSAVTAGRAAPAVGDAQTTAAHDVLAERQRQISVKGFNAERDDRYAHQQLGDAAAHYALMAGGWKSLYVWPWAQSTFKQGTPREMLVKAGALILAEIERLDRVAQQGKGGE